MLQEQNFEQLMLSRRSDGGGEAARGGLYSGKSRNHGNVYQNSYIPTFANASLMQKFY